MKKRRIISFMMSLVIVFVCSFSAFAIDTEKIYNDSEIIKEETSKISEWDIYHNLASKSDSELIEAGYTEETIEKIREFNFEDEIRNMANWETEVLISCGYTVEEIEELRAAAKLKKIPESTIKSISESTMTTKLEYIYNGFETEAGSPMYYVDLKFSWSWSRIPLFRASDMIAVAYKSYTSTGFTFKNISGNKVHANFKPLSSLYTTRTQAVSWDYASNNGDTISASFGTGLVDGSGNLTHFVNSGYGIFRLANRSSKARLSLDASYGHATVSINPSFSVDTTGATPSIDFGWGMDEQHCKGIYYEDFTVSRSYVYEGLVYGKGNTGGAPL